MATAFLPNRHLTLNNKKHKATNELDQLVFGQKMSLMATLFGCWHNNISRPFVQGKTAFRSCLQCGARKQFNPETLETKGSFYFPPIAEKEAIGLY